MSAIRLASLKIEGRGTCRLGKVIRSEVAGRAVQYGVIVRLGVVLCVCLLVTVLFDVSQAWAQSGAVSTAVEAPSFGTVMQKMVPMFAICFAIFYLLVISPQKKEISDQKRLLESLKKGDNVATSGGLLGRVTAIGEDYITISLEQNAAVRVERHHIAKKV